jgi:hypothetical protein
MQEQVLNAPMRIAAVDTSVDEAGILARFALSGVARSRWKGAFSRAMEGRLDGLAGRWWFEPSAVVVARVDATRATAVATAVAAGVEAANDAVDGAAQVAELSRERIANAVAQRRRAAGGAQDAMRAALHVSAAGNGDASTSSEEGS